MLDNKFMNILSIHFYSPDIDWNLKFFIAMNVGLNENKH